MRNFLLFISYFGLIACQTSLNLPGNARRTIKVDKLNESLTSNKPTVDLIFYILKDSPLKWESLNFQ